jgi:hypothetical protein
MTRRMNVATLSHPRGAVMAGSSPAMEAEIAIPRVP